MPDEEKTVDIDTTGPGAEVDISEEKIKEELKIEVQDEKTTQDDTKPDDASEKPSEQLDVRDSKDDQEPVPEKTEEVEKKQELEEYSEGVKKRIAKLTKKWREAERQKEAAIEYARGGQVELNQLKTRLTRLEPNYIFAIENKVKSGLEAAKAKLAASREAGDINAEVEAQKSIAQLGIEESRLGALKEQQALNKEKVIQTPSLNQTLQNIPPPDAKAQDWAENNEWFGKDNAMTYSAFDLHDKLVNQQGYDANSPEYYAEIDKRMRLDFPHKFDRKELSEGTTKPTRIVASAKRSVQPGRNTVRLTSSQVIIAKKLGVPLEEYAKQLKITKEA